MANQQSLTSQDIDRMKNDAIKRARQMQSRATIINTDSAAQSKDSSSSSTAKAQPTTLHGGEQNFGRFGPLGSFKDLFSRLGLNSDQLILFAIIFMLCENRENRMLIMALLYIAL